ncbi:MAG: NADH-quinone oxidoreductase subunit L [Nitrococcus mobilis]|nr:NADH-quinone oxidoreductase subunit L [Nitrococcus mobilis]
MYDALWLVPLLPLIGFVCLTLLGGWLSRRAMAVLGVGSVALATALAFTIGYTFLTRPPATGHCTEVIGSWLAVGNLHVRFGLYLDALALVMMLVVTGVGLLIHLYSATFMAADSGYRRYFAYLNLFVASMLMLVLADNLLLLYLGWEMVGLCSYLLIGHDYADPVNGRAARKAFVVTRIGDAALLVGLLLLLAHWGTLQIQPLLGLAAQGWANGSALATVAAALLLTGAVGKSAQLPLQVWLPDAMAGPTPVSALIHAATMVTAGVYLIARLHTLFELAPAVQHAVAALGALTLLLASCSALLQRDIKRILAYSTISQIGYMFLALGVGAYAAALFHLMTHACFKAVLFLSAGVVINALDEEHDIYHMGGLGRQLPGTSLAFLTGAASLAALPLVSAGFYSKGLILAQTWNAPGMGVWLWTGGILGTLLTAIYIFRAFFVAFLGRPKSHARCGATAAEAVALVVLAALSVTAGFVEIPAGLGGGVQAFTGLVASALPPGPQPAHTGNLPALLELIASLTAVAGVLTAYYFFRYRPPAATAAGAHPITAAVGRLWQSGWGFDWAYERLFVRPLVMFTRANRHDAVDALFTGIAAGSRALHRGLSRTQTGRVRWYAAGIACGSFILIALMVLP